jgi:hypothetical protein
LFHTTKPNLMEKQVRFVAGYKILKEHKLIIELRSGQVNLDCLKAYKMLQSNDKEFDSSFDILSDTSELKLNLIITELKDYANVFPKHHKRTKSGKKVAGIVITPHQIVHGTALQKYLKEANPMEFEFFPDVQSAINWLQKPINEKEVLEILEDIRKNPHFTCK